MQENSYVVQHIDLMLYNMFFYHYLRLATLYGTERPVTACGRYSLRGRCAFRNANIALVCIPRAIIRERGRPRPQYRYKHSAPLLLIFFCGRDAHTPTDSSLQATQILCSSSFFAGGDAHTPTDSSLQAFSSSAPHLFLRAGTPTPRQFFFVFH